MATCTAPGHPDCTITCSGGCIALYYEPDGPCRTMCSGEDKKIQGGPLPAPGNRSISVAASGFPVKLLAELISLDDKTRQRLERSESTVSFEGQFVPFEFFLTAALGVDPIFEPAEGTVAVVDDERSVTIRPSAVLSAKAAALLPCLRFFATGSTTTLGIRNNCAQCKIAVVSWSTNGHNWIRQYRVNAYSEIRVRIEGQYGELIGENPC